MPPAAAIVGGAVIGAAGSVIAGKSAQKGAQAAADAQRDSAALAAQTQQDMYYRGLQLTDPTRRAGYATQVSLLDEIYGPGWGQKLVGPYPDYRVDNYRELGPGDPGYTPPKADPSVGGMVGQLQAMKQSNNVNSWPYGPPPGGDDSGMRPDLNGMYYYGGGGGTNVPPSRMAGPAGSVREGGGLPRQGWTPAQQGGGGLYAAMGNIPQVSMATSPMYQLQLEQGEEGINRALSARGLFNSGAGLETLSDFYRKLAASEVARKQAMLEQIAGYGVGASQAGANAAVQAGGTMANAYSAMGPGVGQALQNAGLARANMYSGLANTASSLLGAYGMAQGFGGGGSTTTPYDPQRMLV